MALNLVKEYVDERNTLLDSIFESTRFLKRVYGNQSRKRSDLEIDRYTYKYESKRLMEILRDFQGLSTKHKSAICYLPKREFDIEIRRFGEVTDMVIEVLESAPRRIRVIKVIPIFNCLQSQAVEVVPPLCIEKVSLLPGENMSHAIVKRTVPCYISSVEVREPQIVKPVQQNCVVKVVQTVSRRVAKLVPTPLISNAVVKEIKSNSASNVFKEKPMLMENFSVPINNFVRVNNENVCPVYDNYINAGNVFETALIGHTSKKSHKINKECNYGLSFNECYCRLLLKCFWAYFMFADFTKLALCDSSWLQKYLRNFTMLFDLSDDSCSDLKWSR